jgi:hypothetical protein
MELKEIYELRLFAILQCYIHMIHRSALKEFPISKNFKFENINQNFRSAFINMLSRKLRNADSIYQWLISSLQTIKSRSKKYAA